MLLGAILVVGGFLLWRTGGLGPIGRLPGDISVKGPYGSFYFPIVTCLVISVVLTLFSWLFRR